MSVCYLTKAIRSVTCNLARGNFYTPLCCHNLTTFTSGINSSGIGVGEKPKKKKTVEIPSITLIQGNQLSVTTLSEAQKLSKRRDLKLVKIVDLDTKTQRPIYKLMTGTEYHAEDLKQRLQKKEEKQGSIKGEKVLILNHNIYEQDLQTQIKKIGKWINKMYEVRIVINGDSSNMEKAEAVYSAIEKTLEKDVKIVQKRQKGSDIKFQLLPPKKNKDDSKGL
ncbi:translation initiation factor IF-3, mitochondrial [Diabrotica undecimpunctata]|uniref:translation initiation factor IF-3, mitochondrial n=1 Tax=Diabrotica undecimpunctata TaxID=50387 RepID=UPI003B635C71